MFRSSDRPHPIVPSIHERHLKAARWLARLLDARWGLGPFRFGAEALLDLIPGVGDAVSVAVSAYQLLVASRLSLPRGKLVRMLVNIAIDLLLGFVPLAGDLADTIFKVHLRNQRIIERHLGGD